MNPPLRRFGILCAFLLSAPLAFSAGAQELTPDLSGASLQDLTQMQVKVSSFARKDQDLWATPAAVFVITREDIERSAVASIPELLRMVPGLQVAQIDASSWAVSARGFNSAYSTKLLVLIDGRTVYSEIYSGAHWDQDDLPLEEIERIEVVRGPGAAVWGTNAVNGVINIITRRARSTLGASASGWFSRVDQIAHLHYGGAFGDRIQYRGYAFFRDRRPFKTATGENAFDGEKSLRVGGRLDWQRTTRDWITVSGDAYKGHLRQQERKDFAVLIDEDGRDSGGVAGAYVLSRWERKLPHSDSAFQAYYDDTSRRELTAFTRTRTLSAEFQDHLAAGTKNDIVWGSEVRFTADHITGPVQITSKSDYHNYLVDAFFQDEIRLIPHRLALTAGSKIQQGTLAGFQLQPSVRLLWSPNDRQSVWAAVSRAAVAPSIQDKAISFPLSFGSAGGLPITGELRGDPAIRPEIVVAWEAGYRRRITSNLTFDVAGFFNVNHRLLSLTIAAPVFTPAPSPHIVQDLMYTNGFRANSAGVETVVSWKPNTKLSFQGTYTWMQVHTAQAQPGVLGLADTWNTPRNSITTNASWQFAPQWGVNTFVSHTDALPADTSLQLGADTGSAIPALNRLDLHLSRRIGHSTVIDAGVTNAINAQHLEFGGGTAAAVPAYIPRNLFVRAKWTF